MRKVVITLLMCIVLIGSAFAQQKVTGKVTGSDGVGIPGVTVLEVGTSNGVLTDIDGQYSLQVKAANAVLRFSFVGMKAQDQSVNGRTVINVQLLSEDIGLDEVVVTALGIKRETKKLGYAMTEVKGDEIAQVNTTNPVQALQGKSAGLSIGSSDGGLFGNSKVQIRGISVLNSNSNQPIFVIDGVILENGISNASADWDSNANDFGNQLKNLNPDDFESISVLKGAAATALYGSRGINGAIVIKTKDGASSKGIGVNVTQTFGVDHVYATPDIQYEYGTGALAGYVDYGQKDANGQYYRFSPSTQFYTNGDGIPTKIGHSWQGMAFGPKYDGRQIEDFDGSMTTYSPSKNNMLDAYDLGFNSNTSVSLSGGNEKGTFYLSDSYNYRKGVMPTNEFTRNSLLFSGSYNLSDWLKAEASVSFVSSKPQNPANDMAENFLNGTWEGWYDTKKWSKRDVYQAPHGGVPSSNYGDQYANVPGNGTWFSYNLNYNTRKEQVTRPMVRLTAKLADWISVAAEANMNHYTVSGEVKQLGQGYANEGGYYELMHSADVSKTAKFTANMNKSWGEDWTTGLILGGEIWDQQKEYTKVRTDGGLIVPGQFFLGNSKKTLLSEGNVNSTKQINSLYFLFNTGWKNQLFLDVTGRNDWSSALVYTDGTGNFSYFYPSVSSSWVFNETFDMPSWVNLGKLRLSWAQVGNDTNPYDINKGYSISNIEMEGGKYVYSNSKSTVLVDPGIKPERKNSFEAGIDVRMLNNRIGVDFAVYDETINNQIGTIPLSSESGYSNMFTNIGSLNNSGVELSLRGVPVKTRDFQWESTFNYWKNTTMISNLRPEVGEYKKLGGDIDYGNFRVGSVAYENGEYGILMSDTKPLEWESSDANDPRNGMKVLTWNDTHRGAYYTRSYKAQEVGKIQPDFEGSWNNSFSYKNFTMEVLLDARFGGHIASYSSKYGTAYGYLAASLTGRDAEHGGLEWTTKYADYNGQNFEDGVIPDGVFKEGQIVTAPDGSKVNVGGLTYKEAFDKGYVEPTHASYYIYRNNSWGSGVINNDWFAEVKYIAVRNISLSYTLPKNIANKIAAKNLAVAFNARNLGYLYNSLPNKINPESFRGTSSTESFRERSFSPYTASYSLSVSIDF